MKEKLKSRSFWITILSEIAALTGFVLSDDHRVQLAALIVAALLGGNYVRCQTNLECIKEENRAKLERIKAEKGGRENG